MVLEDPGLVSIRFDNWVLASRLAGALVMLGAAERISLVLSSCLGCWVSR